MNMIGRNYVPADTSEICRLPCRDNQFRGFIVREHRSSPVRAHSQKGDDRSESHFDGRKCAGFFRSGRATTFGGVAELRLHVRLPHPSCL
jgi:hypothetical protein